MNDQRKTAREIEIEDQEIMQDGALALPSGTSVRRVGTGYVTAMSVQKPRSLAEVQKTFLEEARLAGTSFFYGWGQGENRIEGNSQALAHSLARCWGNCAVDMSPVQDAGDAWIFTAHFVDLQTGFTLARQFRMSKKWTVYGRHDAERKDDIRFQIGASKATRNAILHALPEWLADKGREEAKQGVRDRLQNYIDKNGIAAAQDIAVNRLSQLGVDEEAILRRFEVAKRSALDVDALVLIRGDITAIEQGQERSEDLFPPEDVDASAGAKASDIVDGAGRSAADSPGDGDGGSSGGSPPVSDDDARGLF